jgi:hypothetical protein
MKSSRRRRIGLFILGSIFVLYLIYFFVLYPPLNEYFYESHDQIPVQRMIEKWGDTPFNAIQFKKGSSGQRAAMAADIVQNQRYSGQSIDRVFQDLGQGDFYQNLDEVSEYVLERAGSGWRNSAEYYLEFDYFDKDRRVKSVYVVQRCCRNPYATYWHAKGILKLE